MALGVKVLATAAVLGGGGIAIPLYLKNRGGKVPAINVQAQEPSKSSSVDNSRNSRDSKSIEKVSCNVSASSSASEDMTAFVKDKQNNLDPYSLVSCTNPAVRGDQDSYLGSSWKGLFPTDVLEKKLSYKGQGQISIIATTDTEDNDMGNPIPWTTFSNPDTQDSIKGQWDLEKSNFQNDQKKEVVVSIQGISKTPNKVYLFAKEKN